MREPEDRIYVTAPEIEHNSYAVSGFLNYLFWIDSGLTITTDQVAQLYVRWVRIGEDPYLVCQELGLPIDPDW